MNKKKAIKLATATAIAASAFAAATPAQTQAAVNVDAVVKNAVKKMTDAQNSFVAKATDKKLVDVKTVEANQVAATKEYTAAKATVKKLGGKNTTALTAKLDAAKKTMDYRIKMYVNARKEVSALAVVNQATKKADFAQLEAKVAELEAQLAKTEALVAKVIGSSTRDKMAALAVTPSKATVVKAKADLATAKVVSVNAVNATQVEVKFTKAVDPASLFTNGVSGAFKATVTLTSLDGVASGALTGTLSADGKTLTVTAANPLSKRYDAVVDGVVTKDGKNITKYAEMVTITADTTAPSIVSTTKNSAGSFTVKFSEPVKSLGTVSYKLADGTVVSSTATGVQNDFAAGAQEVTFTVGSEVAAGKEVIATFIGAQDQAGNLLTPNPATVSFVKGDKDGVAPTVSSITQTGAKTFAVKFSEQLLSKPVIEINGVAVAAGNVVKDTNDSTVYNVTAGAVLDGATTVAVKTFSDLSGETGTNVSKVVTFTKDTVAPKVVSSSVVADATSNKQYLEITFDKDVDLSTPTVDGVGSYVKDYVTTPVQAADLNATTVAYKDVNNKKVIRVELDTFLGTTFDVEGATYTLDLTFAGVTTPAGIAADTAKVSFVRGKDGVAANTNVVAVTNVAQGADNNKVEVTFDQAVDGATATDISNYKIDGAVVESVALNPVSGGTQKAILNLKAGSNTFTGTRNINIANIKALGSSKVMTPYFINTVSLNENVAPTIVSAKLTATDKIALTFSEAVSQADTSNKDFEVLIGGQSQAVAEEVDSALTTTPANTVVVTVATIDATKLSKGISLKGLTSLDIVDAAGNKLSMPANIVVSQ